MNVNRPSTTFMVLPGMKPAYTTDPRHPGERRLKGFEWLPNRARNMFIAMMGEFVGTFLFLFFAFAATQVANTHRPASAYNPNPAVLLYISLAFGFSLAVNVWIFFRISGGLFNPAVSVALGLIGAIGWFKVLLLIITQLLGAIAAAGVVSALFPGPLAVRTTLNPTTSVARGLFIEMFLTAELVFTICMLAVEKHKATFLAPIAIGLALFIAELAGVYFTGGSLNPARSFGPNVILGNFNGSHWIYWLGPLLGAILAVIFYKFVKVLEYETANPGQDANDVDVARAGDEARRPTSKYTVASFQAHLNKHLSRSIASPPNSPIQENSYSHKDFEDRRVDGTDDAGYSKPHHIDTHPTGPSTYNTAATSYNDKHPHGGDANYSRESQPDRSRSYDNGPDAESGSAGYSSRTHS